MFVYFASLITVVLLYIRRECFIRHNAVVCCPLWKSPLGTCVLSMLWWIILPIFLIDGWVSILFLGLKLCMKSCSPVLDSDLTFFLHHQVMEQMLIQCNKSNMSYKLHAIQCTTSIIEAWQVHLLERFIPIFEDLSVSYYF